jgi:hypothetical protein
MVYAASAAAVIGLAIGWMLARGTAPKVGVPVRSADATSAGSQPATKAAPARPASLRRLDSPLVDRVVLISIDGLRPDLLVRARTPAIQGLLKTSAFSLWAQTVDHPYVYTLPSHVTMLTGVNPDRHGVTWNDYIEWYPNVPTLFERVRATARNGKPLTTAMATGKMKFVAVNRPGTIDWTYIPPDEPVTDAQVAREATKILREHVPNVLFVHLPGVDTTGHAAGWGSPEQIAALEQADAAVADVAAAIIQLELEASTLLIVTADHGGAALTHWGDDPRSRTIPWIARGPGVRRGYDLTRLPGLDIRTEDTFATICVALGVPLPADTEGRFVMEMLEPKPGQELLQDRPVTVPQ